MPLYRPLLVLAALALLAGLLLYRGDVGDAVGADVTSAPPAPAAPASEAVVVRTARDAAAPAMGAASRPVQASASRRAELRRGFESADDLYHYLQSLTSAAAAGDGDAIWMVSRVYDYCAGFAADPGAYARDTRLLGGMGLRASASMVAARERVGHRCRQFAPGDRLGRELVLYKRVEAAEAGSLAAEASLLAMGEPLDESAEYRRDLVERVQQSRDPEAFGALSPAMGMAANGDPAHAGQVAGTQSAELAWQLAACGLGMDCGPDSTLMTAYCANGGVCSRDGEQDFETFVYDAAIPRQGTDVVDGMVDSLLGEGVPR